MKYKLLALSLVTATLLVSCKCEEQPNPQSDGGYSAEAPKPQEPSTIVGEEEGKSNAFSALETGLPAGIIVGGEQIDGNPSNNFLSIKTPDGTIKVVKNVDWQIYNAVKYGDEIK